MARYFLTGATGFLGGALARRLRAAGHDVVALVRHPGNAGALSALGVTLVPGDITDRTTMAGPMAGADGVFHCAAWYRLGARDKSIAYAANVEGTRNVLEAMRQAAVPKGVYTSTLAVFSDTRGRLVDETYHHSGPFISEYDRTKWLAHYEVAVPMIRRGLPLVIVQPGVIYGPGDHSAVHDAWVGLLTGKLSMVPEGTAYCWAHVDDVAEAHVLAMEKGRAGESYIVAGPRHSFAEAVEMAARIAGVPPPGRRVSPRVLKAVAALLRPIDGVVPLGGQFSPEYLGAIAGTTYIGDNAKARRELGYAPRPLEEGLKDTMAWEKQELARRKSGRAG
jgi:dihydroflavonol-4-reductase